ncbi:MAG: hypothetical protein R3C10_20395 [Pirellulales bacterium]
MARKVFSRRALREEAEAAEKADAGTKKATKKATKKKATKRKATSRSRATKEVRLKALWGVFNQSMRRVAVFEFNEHRKAEKMAAELTEKAKSPHFVQRIKEEIEE